VAEFEAVPDKKNSTKRAWDLTTGKQRGHHDAHTSHTMKIIRDCIFVWNAECDEKELVEGSLDVKLPTIWTDGKAEVGRVREEKKREDQR